MFDVSGDTAVVTSRRVTAGERPILFVAHQFDEEAGVIWQFHDGGDFEMADMQLVRLETILRLDPTVASAAATPIGFVARRKSIDAPWLIAKDPEDSA